MRTLDCLANLVEKYMKNTPKCGIGLYIMLFPFLAKKSTLTAGKASRNDMDYDDSYYNEYDDFM